MLKDELDAKITRDHAVVNRATDTHLEFIADILSELSEAASAADMCGVFGGSEEWYKGCMLEVARLAILAIESNSPEHW